MNVREPARAGSFYEAAPESCRAHATALIESAVATEPPTGEPLGGLVPHAGWTFSGRLAAMTLKMLGCAQPPETLVLLGADHFGTVHKGEVYAAGAWRTPLGEAGVDEELAAALLAAGDCLRDNPDAHGMEHSIEVQVPIVQTLYPEARIVPVAVPPSELAVEIGRTIGATLKDCCPGGRIVGSTDLTHHGGHFGNPGGRGEQGVAWTVANDRRMLDLIEAMDAEAVIDEAQMRGNACGAGAIAAAIAACRELGATRGVVLEYTNSYEVLHEMTASVADDTTVGYASVVFI
jgi:MEMO1 family protein